MEEREVLAVPAVLSEALELALWTETRLVPVDATGTGFAIVFVVNSFWVICCEPLVETALRSRGAMEGKVDDGCKLLRRTEPGRTLGCCKIGFGAACLGAGGALCFFKTWSPSVVAITDAAGESDFQNECLYAARNPPVILTN